MRKTVSLWMVATVMAALGVVSGDTLPCSPAAVGHADEPPTMGDGDVPPMFHELAASRSEASIERIKSSRLPNLIRLHTKVLSGGTPHGVAAFCELYELGVQTIISVDGARPDTVTAKQFGIRYVHLPVGYRTISAAEGRKLAKAVQQLDGVIYVHCHHGKHRSPAAAAVACVVAGLLPESLGPEVLKVAQTSPHYRGLFQAVKEAKALDARTLADLDFEFPAVAELPGATKEMVAINELFVHLQEIAKGKRPFADEPKDGAAHQALLLREHFHELSRSALAEDNPEAFRQIAQAAEQQCRELEQMLRRSTPGNDIDARSRQQLGKVLLKIERNCVECHRAYRN